jgi:seryl-tRNA synthetase
MCTQKHSNKMAALNAATVSIDQRDLVKAVRKFREYDDKLKELNKEVYKLREAKKLVEEEMAGILKRGPFATLDKLELAGDQSRIVIQRPGTYSKPWSYGQKDLDTDATDYFARIGRSREEAKGFVDFAKARKKSQLVSAEFSFKRVVNVDDNASGAAE